MSDIPWNVWVSYWLKVNVVGFTIDPSVWPQLLYLLGSLCVLLSLLAFRSKG
jgi:hypothetical protein